MDRPAARGGMAADVADAGGGLGLETAPLRNVASLETTGGVGAPPVATGSRAGGESGAVSCAMLACDGPAGGSSGKLVLSAASACSAGALGDGSLRPSVIKRSLFLRFQKAM